MKQARAELIQAQPVVGAMCLLDNSCSKSEKNDLEEVHIFSPLYLVICMFHLHLGPADYPRSFGLHIPAGQKLKYFEEKELTLT